MKHDNLIRYVFIGLAVFGISYWHLNFRIVSGMDVWFLYSGIMILVVLLLWLSKKQPCSK